MVNIGLPHVNTHICMHNTRATNRQTWKGADTNVMNRSDTYFTYPRKMFVLHAVFPSECGTTFCVLLNANRLSSAMVNSLELKLP